jgi:hypothetical protein
VWLAGSSKVEAEWRCRRLPVALRALSELGEWLGDVRAKALMERDEGYGLRNWYEGGWRDIPFPASAMLGWAIRGW